MTPPVRLGPVAEMSEMVIRQARSTSPRTLHLSAIRTQYPRLAHRSVEHGHARRWNTRANRAIDVRPVAHAQPADSESTYRRVVRCGLLSPGPSTKSDEDHTPTAGLNTAAEAC